MSGRPSLKLKFGKTASTPSSPHDSPAPPAPAPPTQAAPAPATKKLTIKLGSKTPAVKEERSSPQPSAAKPKKKAKAPAADKRPAATKKRARPDEGNKIGGQAAAAAAEPAPTVKRIKFSSSKPPPSLRIKNKGEPLKRGKGVGYDSEASDTEIDPAIEEQFILRMQPGEDCDYLRKAVEEKRFGFRSQGGADVSIKPLTRDGRRATVTIQGRIYAASLVDLPCIVEGMKSWDKRGWYKSADICQMLLVLGRINSEDEAHSYPLPKDVDDKTWQYAHGLTPPMRWVKKRRFRERISNRTIEAVELEVARLIRQDEEAIEPPDFEIMDYAQYTGEASMQRSEEADEMAYDDEQDAEGEEEYYDTTMQNQDEVDDFEDALAAEMEAALAAGADGDAGEAALAPEVEVVGDGEGVAEGEVEVEVELEGDVEAGTPGTKPSTGGESSGDESDDSSQAQSDADEELDEDALEQQRQLQQQREEIAELEALIQNETVKWEQMTNTILKGKLGKRVQSLKQDLDLKRVSIGEGGADA
ncbi:hypothetical protein FQN54_009237 [Arachnomyces sp. PD_36]|nr:hypothetical protein FQN54_009237 [Arachnomyces sp. PD_36]